MNYLRLAALVFVVLLFPAGYLKGCADEKDRFDAYKVVVEAAGKAQEERTAARIAHDELLKEEADNDHQVALAKLRADVDRLRARRSSAGILPPAAPGSDRPDRAAFDRSELERALRSLDAGVQGLVDEGSRAVIDLDTARRWAHGR